MRNITHYFHSRNMCLINFVCVPNYIGVHFSLNPADNTVVSYLLMPNSLSGNMIFDPLKL